ncbi:unnamed protein product [Heterobilharzia americana]|nr:unnamed protein product [Heterobilharzia americana]
MHLEVEPVILRNYEIKKRLGKGAYGIVWKAENRKTHKTVALKKIFDAFRNQTDAQRTFREITFLQEFSDHPNIIRLLNVIKAENDKDIYLVFEYMETDLHNCIKKGGILKDVHKRFILYQLFRAVKYIHSGNVIHRDLKPSNVLLNSDCLVKLCDFGLTRSLTNTTGNRATSVESFVDGDDEYENPGLTEYVATRWYRAPEILLASNCYTKYVDMWSLGCILGEMLLGKALFPGTSTINQIERIISAVERPSLQDIEFRDPSSEIVLNHSVTPILSDAKQLSVSDYRQKLYEIIMEKKAQHKIRKLLRSVELNGNAENLSTSVEASFSEHVANNVSTDVATDKSVNQIGDPVKKQHDNTFRSRNQQCFFDANEMKSNSYSSQNRSLTKYRHNGSISSLSHVIHSNNNSAFENEHTSKSVTQLNPTPTSLPSSNNTSHMTSSKATNNLSTQLSRHASMPGSTSNTGKYTPQSISNSGKNNHTQLMTTSMSREINNPVIVRSNKNASAVRNTSVHNSTKSVNNCLANRQQLMSTPATTSIRPAAKLFDQSISNYNQTYGTLSLSQLNQLHAQKQSKKWDDVTEDEQMRT